MVVPNWLTSRFFKPKAPVYNDSIIDALACWEILWGTDEYLNSLCKQFQGVWGAREAVASSINPTVRHYYSIYGADVDFDGVFIEPLLIEMYKSNWNMGVDYSKVCQETRDQWFN